MKRYLLGIGIFLLSGCSWVEIEEFLEELGEPQGSSVSAPAGEPKSNCRTSPAGINVCSPVYAIDDNDLFWVDQAWLATLNCVEVRTRNINTHAIPKPSLIEFIPLSQVPGGCRGDISTRACYIRSFKKIIVSPQTFSTAITHEIGHHIDYEIGNGHDSCRHGLDSFAIRCSASPLGDWSRQAASIKEFWSGKPYDRCF